MAQINNLSKYCMHPLQKKQSEYKSYLRSFISDSNIFIDDEKFSSLKQLFKRVASMSYSDAVDEGIDHLLDCTEKEWPEVVKKAKEIDPLHDDLTKKSKCFSQLGEFCNIISTIRQRVLLDNCITTSTYQFNPDAIFDGLSDYPTPFVEYMLIPRIKCSARTTVALIREFKNGDKDAFCKAMLEDACDVSVLNNYFNNPESIDASIRASGQKIFLTNNAMMNRMEKLRYDAIASLSNSDLNTLAGSRDCNLLRYLRNSQKTLDILNRCESELLSQDVYRDMDDYRWYRKTKENGVLLDEEIEVVEDILGQPEFAAIAQDWSARYEGQESTEADADTDEDESKGGRLKYPESPQETSQNTAEHTSLQLVYDESYVSLDNLKDQSRETTKNLEKIKKEEKLGDIDTIRYYDYDSVITRKINNNQFDKEYEDVRRIYEKFVLADYIDHTAENFNAFMYRMTGKHKAGVSPSSFIRIPWKAEMRILYYWIGHLVIPSVPPEKNRSKKYTPKGTWERTHLFFDPVNDSRHSQFNDNENRYASRYGSDNNPKNDLDTKIKHDVRSFLEGITAE